ncbi:hypothetical protein CEXT_279841 [Caerostris extrusa]|uniref:Uncharacterized protein n=1 Tax=Caerostris extrusa TaxID=172846 RepID=A0AAV4XMD3_CAEEX|nr:hypothetical protein CEXT_279841 [Caerostris extrusa]
MAPSGFEPETCGTEGQSASHAAITLMYIGGIWDNFIEMDGNAVPHEARHKSWGSKCGQFYSPLPQLYSPIDHLEDRWLLFSRIFKRAGTRTTI